MHLVTATISAEKSAPGGAGLHPKNRVNGLGLFSLPRVGLDVPFSADCVWEIPVHVRKIASAKPYDPTTAQFLTRDPAVALTMSPYGYASGNPLSFSDPSGLDPRSYEGLSQRIGNMTNAQIVAKLPNQIKDLRSKALDLQNDENLYNLKATDPASYNEHIEEMEYRQSMIRQEIAKAGDACPYELRASAEPYLGMSFDPVLGPFTSDLVPPENAGAVGGPGEDPGMIAGGGTGNFNFAVGMGESMGGGGRPEMDE